MFGFSPPGLFLGLFEVLHRVTVSGFKENFLMESMEFYGQGGVTHGIFTWNLGVVAGISPFFLSTPNLCGSGLEARLSFCHQ